MGADGYHALVARFKRELLTHMLAAHGGNRSRTARKLGLQRTYLVRLVRAFEVNVPPPTRNCRNGKE